jgi:hypothetical protein
VDDPRVAAFGLSIQAQLDEAAGRLDAAYDHGFEAARLGLENAVWPAEIAAHAALWLRDRERARAAITLHAGRPERGRYVSLARKTLSAGLRALEGDADGGALEFREAWRGYLELGLGLGLSLGYSLITAVAVLPPDHQDSIAADAQARELFERLGARALLDRLDDARRRAREAAPSRPTSGESVVV